MGLFTRKTMFDIVKEADDDNAAATDTGGDAAASSADAGADEAPSPDQSGEDASGGDDDFDIDTNLDDNGDNGGDDAAGDTGTDDTGGGDSGGSSDLGGGGGGLDDSEAEVIPANTDIFSTLTQEEQQVKIKELQKLYTDLYFSIDDILDRINDTPSDEDNIEVIARVSTTIYSLRQYLHDYITKIFVTKSYIENDINFNRFLSILNGVTTVIEELGAIKKQKAEKENKN